MVSFGHWVPQPDLYLRLDPQRHALCIAEPCATINHWHISLPVTFETAEKLLTNMEVTEKQCHQSKPKVTLDPFGSLHPQILISDTITIIPSMARLHFDQPHQKQTFLEFHSQDRNPLMSLYCYHHPVLLYMNCCDKSHLCQPTRKHSWSNIKSVTTNAELMQSEFTKEKPTAG
jgi:hypothetical protein